MLHKAVKAVGTLAAAAMLATGAAGTASATNQVDCAGRWDFVSLWSTNGTRYCFANGGDLNVTVPVYRIGSGNNRLIVTFSDGTQIDLGKYVYADISRTVTHLHVY